MNIARLGEAGSEIPVLQRDGVSYDLRSITADIDGAFLAGGIDRARAALDAGELPQLENASNLRIGAPIARPGKIVCIGLNYRDHAEEIGADPAGRAGRLLKDPATMVGPFDDVLIPRASAKTDWEVELAVVIGTTARYLDSPDDALACVAGYAVSHDVSEREFQLERGGQWDKGKSCETFNPLGPVLVTADEVARSPGARAAPVRQRHAAAGRHHREHDLPGRAHRLVPQPVHGAAPRRRRQHRHSGRRRPRLSRATPTCATATWSSSTIDGLGTARQKLVQA